MPRPFTKKLSIQSYRSTQQMTSSLERQLTSVFNAQVCTPFSDKIINDQKLSAYDFSLVYQSFHTPKYELKSYFPAAKHYKSDAESSETSLDAVGKMLQMDIQENRQVIEDVQKSVAELEAQCGKFDSMLADIERMQLALTRKSKKKAGGIFYVY